MSLTQMFIQAGWVAKTVILILFILSIYSIAIMFEKFTSYRAARKESLEFLPAVERCPKGDKLRKRSTFRPATGRVTSRR
jgi:biopolymer transport protein ExbB/biopolymer transport protein TolQ